MDIKEHLYSYDLIKRAKKQIFRERINLHLLPIIGGIICYFGVNYILAFFLVLIGLIQHIKFDLKEDLINELEKCLKQKDLHS
jgi:uncharacterized metal-binding protein